MQRWTVGMILQSGRSGFRQPCEAELFDLWRYALRMETISAVILPLRALVENMSSYGSS